jgi:hypothetical protein
MGVVVMARGMRRRNNNADNAPSWPPSISRAVQEEPSSLSPRSRNSHTRLGNPMTLDLVLASRWLFGRWDQQKRRAQANGEQLEKYQRWYWPASGMDHETADFEKTVNMGPSQPVFYVNTFNSPKTDGKVGNWKVASSDRDTPAPSALAESVISQQQGRFSGRLWGPTWFSVGETSILQGLQWARPASTGLYTQSLGCSRLCYRC